MIQGSHVWLIYISQIALYGDSASLTHKAAWNIILVSNVGQAPKTLHSSSTLEINSLLDPTLMLLSLFSTWHKRGRQFILGIVKSGGIKEKRNIGLSRSYTVRKLLTTKLFFHLHFEQ